MASDIKLRFPHRYSLGSVYMAPQSQPESWQLLDVPQGLVTKPENQPIHWEWLDEARGTLTVPEGMKVKLRVNNSAVMKLASLKDLGADCLHTLDLARTGMNDQYVPHLLHLKGLKTLELAYTAVSDEGLLALSELDQLNTLGLTHNAITNTGLRGLASMLELRELWLNGTLIDDEGMPHLAGLSNLVLLGLSSTRVTSEGLAGVYPLSNLLRLYMFNTAIDEDAAAIFRSKVPGCRVKWRRAAPVRPEFVLADDFDPSIAYDEEMDIDLEEDLEEGLDEILALEFPGNGKARSKHVKPMADESFWKLIELFDWDRVGDDTAVIEPCVSALSRMETVDIYAFQEALYEKLYALDSADYARHIGRESYRSKDDYFSRSWFLNVRCCAVANGRELYGDVLSDPANMPRDLGFRAVCRVAEEAYFRKTGEKMSYQPAHDCETFSNREGWPDMAGR